MVCDDVANYKPQAKRLGVVLKSIFNGQYPGSAIHKMNRKRLERTVSSAIIVAAPTSKHRSRPKWWPYNLQYVFPLVQLRKKVENVDISCVPKQVSWTGVLKELLMRCARFYRYELLRSTFEPQHSPTLLLSAAVPQRKVLGVKQINSSTCEREKRRDTLNAKEKEKNRERERRPLKKRKDKRRSKTKPQRQAYVKLTDIRKELPLTKVVEEPVTQESFMASLGLHSQAAQKVPSPPRSEPSNHSIKVKNYLSGRFPFSSDYGRHIINHNRHLVPDIALTRKLERIEWNLRETERLTHNLTPDFEVTYESKRHEYVRPYRFPQTRYAQQSGSVRDQFVRYVCKPVCVLLERMDLEKERERIRSRSVVNGRPLQPKRVVHQKLLVMIRPMEMVKSNGTLRRSARLEEAIIVVD